MWQKNDVALPPPVYFRDFTKQTTKPTAAAKRITGSASIKTGIVPDVSVTIVEASRTRQIPDASITKPTCNFCILRPKRYAIRQTTAPISR